MTSDNFFFGPKGLRLGWRILSFLLVLVAAGSLISVIWRFVFAHGHATKGPLVMTPGTMLIAESATLVTVLVTLCVMALIDRVSVGSYGIPLQEAFRGKFWGGIFAGLAGMTLLLASLRGLHGFYFGTVDGPAGLEFKYGVLYAIGFLFVGFFEELLLRSYLLFSLTRSIGFWAAAVVTSLIFAAAHMHNPGENPVGIVAVFVAGMAFCFLVRRTGNLWFPIGFHASWDWAQTYFYGVPDSGITASGSLFHSHLSGPTWLTGGSVGPEGSYLVFLVLGLIVLAVHVLYRGENRYHPEEVLTRLPKPRLPEESTAA